ncbi:MAG: hypothetical protein MHMPM18_004721 [Marteilia pararefringens]
MIPRAMSSKCDRKLRLTSMPRFSAFSKLQLFVENLSEMFQNISSLVKTIWQVMDQPLNSH